MIEKEEWFLDYFRILYGIQTIFVQEIINHIKQIFTFNLDGGRSAQWWTARPPRYSSPHRSGSRPLRPTAMEAPTALRPSPRRPRPGWTPGDVTLLPDKHTETHCSMQK